MKKLFILISLIILSAFAFIPLSFADLSGNMTASATVLPGTSDYQFSLGQEYGLANISQQANYTYVITYGAEQSAYFNTPNTIITFNWGNDLGPNNLHMFDYVIGSASNAYGGVPPVIDVTNRTITWTIPSLPAGTTDQKLYVVLYSNTYNIPDHPFTVNLSATMSNQYVTMPEQTVGQTYTYQPPLPGPTETPVPQQPTPTPTPTPQPSQITNVAISNVSNNNATIRIDTIGPSKLTVNYGTSQNDLTQTVTTNGYLFPNNITLPNLLSNTQYYFRIDSMDLTGQTTYSEIFSFKTAKMPLVLNVANNIIVLSANGQVLLSNLQSQSAQANPSVILPVNSDYEIDYAVVKQIALKSIDAIIINKILGSSTLAATELPSELIIPMKEKTQSLYVANVNTLVSGLYQVDVRIEDENGNIVEKEISNLKVMPHLTVYAQDTNAPLADARVYFYYFDPQTNSYQPLSPQLFPNIPNPNYTNSQGQSMIILPEGKYRVDESALFYNKASANFTIGPGSEQNFPTIYLKRDPFNLISLAVFVKDYLSDTWSKTAGLLQGLAKSIRLFHLFAVIILGSFVFLNFFFFFLRSHIHIKYLPVFFLFNVYKLFNKHRQLYFFGTVTTVSHLPISRALLEVEDADTKNILGQMTTNKAGSFYFKNTFSSPINLLVTREGFKPTTVKMDMTNKGIHIVLEKGEIQHKSLLTYCVQGIEEVLGLLFEVSLVISIILEIFFLSIYGWEKGLLYFVLSIINLIFWLFYLHEKSSIAQL